MTGLYLCTWGPKTHLAAPIRRLNEFTINRKYRTRKALGELRPPPAAQLPICRTVGSSDTWLQDSRLLYDRLTKITTRQRNKHCCHVTSSLGRDKYLITLCVITQGERGPKGLPVSF